MSSRIEKLAAHVRGEEAPAGATIAREPTTAQGASQVKMFGKVGSKSPSDVVIVAAYRTPICKGNKGAFKDTTPDELLMPVLKAILDKTGISPNIVGDCLIGNVQTVGSYVTPGRAAQLRAGYPPEVPFATVNRQCSSGLHAVSAIAANIATGLIDCGIGGGVEHMSSGGNPSDPSSLPPMNMGAIFEHPVAKETLTPMGITSENVAEKYGLKRADLDAFSVRSHEKALKAQKEGLFTEIVPVTVTVTDKDGNEKQVTVTADEGPKASTVEGLAKLKPAFKKDGSTTAGNSSQVSDGAAAVLLMRRDMAERLKLPILGVFRGAKVVGVDPAIMGVGPAYAIPALLADTGLSVKDVDVFEINEAFASQALWCVRQLGIDEAKVNPQGSGISLGHPLGCTGARQVATLMQEFKRNPKLRTGVVSMCVGGGQGYAALFEAA